MEELSNGQYVRGEGAATPLFEDDAAPTQRHTVIPRFFKEPRKNPNTGEWHDVEMVEMLIAGDRINSPVRKMTDQLRDRFYQQYDRWKRDQELSVDGTPLEVWPVLTGQPALIQTMKLNHVHTVEALAQIPDTALQGLGMSARRLRELAKVYVESKEGSDGNERLAKENAELRDKMAVLEEQMKALIAAKPETKPEEDEAEVDSDNWREITPWPRRASFVEVTTGTRPKNMEDAEKLMASAMEPAA